MSEVRQSSVGARRATPGRNGLSTCGLHRLGWAVILPLPYSGLRYRLETALSGGATLDDLTQLAAEATASTASREKAIEDGLAPLVDRGLMVRDGNSFLSLAIPLGEYSPSEAILERFYRLVDTIGTTTNGITVLRNGNRLRTTSRPDRPHSAKAREALFRPIHRRRLWARNHRRGA